MSKALGPLCKHHQYRVNYLLCQAIEHDHMEDAKKALELGANPNIIYWGSRTPLKQAVSIGSYELTELLLQNSAIVDFCGDDGYIPLHCASIAGKVQITKLLLQYRANANAQEKYTNKTPLSMAVMSSSLQVVKLLMSYGASPDIVGIDEESPLDYALKYNKHSIALILQQSPEELLETNLIGDN